MANLKKNETNCFLLNRRINTGWSSMPDPGIHGWALRGSDKTCFNVQLWNSPPGSSEVLLLLCLAWRAALGEGHSFSQHLQLTHLCLRQTPALVHSHWLFYKSAVLADPVWAFWLPQWGNLVVAGGWLSSLLTALIYPYTNHPSVLKTLLLCRTPFSQEGNSVALPGVWRSSFSYGRLAC